MLKSIKIKAAGVDWKETVVTIGRVNKTTKGGRSSSIRALVVVGNGKGIVGYGTGKDKETTGAIKKATEQAKKNLKEVRIINGTIPYQCEAKHDGARLYMKPASKGTGIKAGGALRTVLGLVGIKDILSKSKGSSNPISLVVSSIKALSGLRRPIDIAKMRGISLQEVFEGVKTS